MTLVVADTSVVLNLCCIGRAGLLRSGFGRVLVPERVFLEFSRLTQHSPRFSGLVFPEWIVVERELGDQPETLALFKLDEGELAALTLAAYVKADAVLMDESMGRRAAEALGLTTLGILGILLRAKAKGSISSVSAEMAMLEKKAGFWINPKFKRQVLEAASEWPED